MARPLTTPQAAEILGVTAATVRVLAGSGELPHRKTAGGHRRFLEEDVRALRLERDTRNRSGAAAKAVTWRRATLGMLKDAEADIGASSPHAEPFRTAAEALRRSFKKSYRESALEIAGAGPIHPGVGNKS